MAFIRKIIDTWNTEQIKTKAANLLLESEDLAAIINTTMDEKDFFESYERLIAIFEELIKYEKYNIFSGQSPSSNLRKFKNLKEKSTKAFYERKSNIVYTSSIKDEDCSKSTKERKAAILDNYDTYFAEAGRFIIDKDKASIGMLQRVFNIGFNRSAQIMDQLCDAGVVGEEEGTRPRRVLMNMEEFEYMINNAIRVNHNEINNLTDLNREIVETPALPPSEIIEQMLGIPPNFSKDGQRLSHLENMLVHKCKKNQQLEIINNLIISNSPETMRLIILDNNGTYINYNILPHLLVPVTTDMGKFAPTIHWSIAEKRERMHKFADIRAKDIDSYNNTTSQKIPHLIFIISELYETRSIQEIDDSLIQLLLNSNMTGMHCIFFSQFETRNLALGAKADLLHICDTQQAKKICEISKNHDRNNYLKTITGFDNMDGTEFEGFCATILEKNHFHNVKITPGSGDHGVDILAEKDDITYAIQCKCYSSNIGNSSVQQAHTGKSIYNKDIAVVLTNRHFTQQAIDEAKALGVKLWDRDKLNSMINNSSI